jgi:hypothetical protein
MLVLSLPWERVVLVGCLAEGHISHRFQVLQVEADFLAQ